MAFDWTFGYVGFLGVVATISLILFIGWILAKAKIKIPIVGDLLGNIPAKWMMFGALGFVLLVVLPMIGLQLIPKQGFSTSGNVVSSSGDGTTIVTASGTCNSPTGGNTASLLLAVENIDNPADAYLAEAVSVVKADGTIDQTGATTAGTTLAYVTLAVTPCETGKVYFTSNSTRVVEYDSLQPQQSKTVDGSLTTTVNLNVLNFNTGASLLANGSIPATGTCPAGATSVCGDVTASGLTANANTSVVAGNQTLGSGGSVNYYMTIVANTANSRYGTFDDVSGTGAVLSAYVSDLTAFSATGQKIASIDGGATLSEVTCPSDVTANRRANKCWDVSTLKSGYTYKIGGTWNSDLGDPAPQDYIDLCVDDYQTVKDTDGKFKKVAFLIDGTNIGSAGSCARFLFN